MRRCLELLELICVRSGRRPTGWLAYSSASATRQRISHLSLRPPAHTQRPNSASTASCSSRLTLRRSRGRHPARPIRRHPAPYRPAQTVASPGMSGRHPVPSHRPRQDRCARIAGKECHSAPPTPPIGPQSSGSARRWPSFEGELHVERFRVTLNGLGGFHMGNPGL